MNTTTPQLSDVQKYLLMAQDSVVTFAPKVLLALVIFFVGQKVISKINEITNKALASRNIEPTIQPFFASLVDVSLKLVLFLVVANIFGFETTSFVAILSAMAFAVGLALQGSLGHFASGILLLLFKPYRVGDEIQIGEMVGFVKEIQVFNTILRTRDNRIVVLPNGNVTSSNIINLSAHAVRRVDLILMVDEHNDAARVKRVIEEVVDSCPYVIKGDYEHPIEVFLYKFSTEKLKFAVRPWCKTEYYWQTWGFITEQSKIRFDQENLDSNITYIKMITED
jgi:small conductance mechanosensitive channel